MEDAMEVEAEEEGAATGVIYGHEGGCWWRS
jgi:hypothetical protein